MAKVLIVSPHPIGQTMAGPAIRAWECAHGLAKRNHEVVLFSPDAPEQRSDLFEVVSLHQAGTDRHFQTASVLFTQTLPLSLARKAARHHLKIIIDAYDPSPLELLESHQTHAPAFRKEKVDSAITNLIFSFSMANGILCASEKQRSLWIGFLLGQKLITPSLYDLQSNFRHFIAVVPFGLPSLPPQKNGFSSLRDKFGLKATDRVILWGGGIWDWFDPLTLIKAMQLISEQRTDIKLVFMGIKSPDPQLPALTMAAQAVELARALQLKDQSVFFNEGWVPYEERQNMLLEADLGASIHFNHLETQFSFRTRMLDYIWAQLPIIATEGDAFAELIEQQELGLIVPYGDEKALAEAILGLLDDPDRIQKMRDRLAQTREQFHWDKIIDPLDHMIKRIDQTSPPRQPWKDRMCMARFAWTKVREKGLRFCFGKLCEKINPGKK